MNCNKMSAGLPFARLRVFLCLAQMRYININETAKNGLDATEAGIV